MHKRTLIAWNIALAVLNLVMFIDTGWYVALALCAFCIFMAITTITHGD